MAARLGQIDFLHRPALDPSDGQSEITAPDPIIAALSDWYATADTARSCHGSAWLELDGPIRLGVPARKQGVSICLDPDIGRPEPRDPARLQRPTGALLDTFARLQRACGREEGGAEVLARVHRAVLVVGGWLRHLSVMRGRAGQPGKIYAALPKGSLGVFLAEIGWPGDSPAARMLADLVCAESGRINLDLQFEEALAPRIGFELFFDPSPARDPARKRPLGLARSLGLLSAEQAIGLASWVGLFQVSSQAWGEVRVQRWFDLKFVLLPTGIELKAYLGFRLCEDAP